MPSRAKLCGANQRGVTIALQQKRRCLKMQPFKGGSDLCPVCWEKRVTFF
jgi:hypothetical protein